MLWNKILERLYFISAVLLYHTSTIIVIEMWFLKQVQLYRKNIQNYIHCHSNSFCVAIINIGRKYLCNRKILCYQSAIWKFNTKVLKHFKSMQLMKHSFSFLYCSIHSESSIFPKEGNLNFPYQEFFWV